MSETKPTPKPDGKALTFNVTEPSTTSKPMVCATCHRIVYADHLDAGGRCCFCQPKGGA